MALSAAERQRKRRERIRSDPVKLEEKRRKDRESWHRRKMSIEALSERSARKLRKQWRTTKRSYRERQNMVSHLLPDSPPNSPPSSANLPTTSRQYMAGQRKRKHNVEKITKQLHLMKDQLADEKRKSQKYRKRWQRSLMSTTQQCSPRSKTKVLLKNLCPASAVAKRELLFYTVLVQEIKNRYVYTKQERLRRLYSRVFTGNLVKKYKLQKVFQQTFGFSAKRFKTNNDTTAQDDFKRKHMTSKAVMYGKLVHKFYLREDNARTTAGKKETVTKFKQKKQRMLLSDSLKNLHAKFCMENPSVRISYSLFCSLRPFWLRFPCEKDRNTCMCKLHANIDLMTQRLASLNVIKSTEFIDDVSCDPKSANCMYGKCSDCKHPQMPVLPTFDGNVEIAWQQWKTMKEERTVGKTTKLVTVTKKVTITGTIFDLLDQCNNALDRFKIHHFNIYHQYLVYRTLRTDLTDTQCVLHVDFSENYAAKLSEEVQSMHFGASQIHITLHTGVYYVGPSQSPNTFCTISDDCSHSPVAIWTHLQPVIREIKDRYPAVNEIHIWSDGPTTQYRQKNNFFLFSNILPNQEFKYASWNFFECGHGKGVPDGVGATLKRTADRLVLQGRDVTDGASFYEQLSKETRIQLFYIPDNVFSEAKLMYQLPTDLPTVPGTMRLHQVIWDETLSKSSLMYRNVSCFCLSGKPCPCYEQNNFQFPTQLNEAPTQTISPCERDAPHNDREVYFRELLRRLQTCTSYEELNEMCTRVTGLDELIFPERDPLHAAVIENQSQIDDVSTIMMPDRMPKHLKPRKTTADGNCLPRTGSYLAFGHECWHEEVRARIVIEQCVNSNLYLDPEHLRKGMNQIHDREASLLVNHFCSYSGIWNGSRLTKNTIVKTYKDEVLDIVKASAYMGIWQIMALANILRVQIQTVYPDGGNPSVRRDLHRIICPANATYAGNGVVYIMWTNTRLTDPFSPNHFVPLLPIDDALSKSTEEECLLDKLVVVRYENAAYPGLVVDIDDHDLQVKCLHKIGDNRFYWPNREDICWYSKDNILAIIPELQQVTGRHVQVPPLHWANIMKEVV